MSSAGRGGSTHLGQGGRAVGARRALRCEDSEHGRHVLLGLLALPRRRGPPWRLQRPHRLQAARRRRGAGHGKEERSLWNLKEARQDIAPCLPFVLFQRRAAEDVQATLEEALQLSDAHGLDFVLHQRRQLWGQLLQGAFAEVRRAYMVQGVKQGEKVAKPAGRGERGVAQMRQDVVGRVGLSFRVQEVDCPLH